jgi:hypothetical protein
MSRQYLSGALSISRDFEINRLQSSLNKENSKGASGSGMATNVTSYSRMPTIGSRDNHDYSTQ